MVHLDTNFLIKAIRPGSSEDAKLGSWLAEGESLGISSIAWAEFFAGPLSKADELVVRQMFGAVEGSPVAMQKLRRNSSIKQGEDRAHYLTA